MKCRLSLLCGGASVRPPATHRSLTGLSYSGLDRPAPRRRIAGPLTSAARMLAAIAILAAPVAASAGHYKFYYSGPAPYHHEGPEGDGTFIGQQAGVPPPSVSGAVTITFVWAPDGGADAPPASTFVTITSSAEADSVNYAFPSYPQASASSGLPNATHTTTHPDTRTTTDRDVATYTFVQSEPGNSFTYTFSPAMSGSGNGMIFGNDVMGISATTTPVVIGFQGVSGDVATGFRQIVGQKFTAAVSAGSCTFSNMEWGAWTPDSLDPGNPLFGCPSSTYSIFDASLASGHAYLYAQSVFGSVYGKAYFAKPSQYSFHANGQALLNGTPYQVSARQTINVVAPISVFDSKVAPACILGVVAVSEADPNKAELYTIRSPAESIIWNASAATPPGFGHGGEGLWHTLQLVTPGRTVVYPDVVMASPMNGLQGLDTALPYQPTDADAGADAGWPDDGVTRNENQNLSDQPSHAFLPDAISFTIDEHFEMYLLYKPFDGGLGSEWVPLRRTKWNWAAQAAKPVNGWPGPAVGPMACGSYASSDEVWSIYPEWTRLVNTANLMGKTP